MSSIRFRVLIGLACAAALGSAASVRAQPKPPDRGSAPPGGQPNLPAAAPSGLGDDSELARATNLYESGQYRQCAKSFAELLDPKSPRALHDTHIIETARVYYAACLIGSGRRDEAGKPLKDAIRDNPQMKTPDSTIFPQPVIDKFLQVRQSLLEWIHKEEQARIKTAQAAARKAEQAEKARRARIVRLKELASEETVITKNSRWIAALPFGIGQFQNRQPALGFTFLTTESLLAGTTLGMIILESHFSQQAFDPGKATALAQNHKSAQTVLVVSSWSLFGVAALGIIQAELAFKPEFRDGVRKRKLPPELESAGTKPSITPSAGPVAGGGFTLGVTGRF